MTESPIAEVLGTILSSLFPGRSQGEFRKGERPKDDTEFLVVSYRRDFAYLWNIDESFLAWLTNGPRTLILVWDETPSGGLGDIPLNEYVTAFDWSVALSLLADSYTRAHTRVPQWRLLIADLASKKHSSAQGVRLFSAFQRSDAPLLPWVRFFSVEEFATLFDLLNIAQPLVHPRTTDLEMLRTTWAALLVNPASASDRHAIVNLVAPRVLLTGMSKSSSNRKDAALPLVGALDLLMYAVGLLPDVSEQLPGPWVGPKRWKNVIDKFILMDDMADLGWEDFLGTALGTTDSQLETHTDAGSWQSVCDQDKVILFLDLRLFTRRPDDEVAFFRELLLSARNFGIEDDESADSGFYATELQAIERVINSGHIDSPDYYTALTFLPRLISLTDPTLPIVMFSSTGRREIAEALRPFGNIVLGLDKPRFFGDSSGSVLAETRQKFETAMQDALILAEGRDLCRTLRKAPPPATAGRPTGRIVEIFLDESRSQDYLKFAVGGLVLVHGENGSPSGLDTELRHEKLVWTNSAGAQALPKDPSNYGPYLARLQNFFEERGIEIFAFALWRSRQSPGAQPRSVILREGSLDLQNLDMVTDAVEATLFDVIDAIAPDPSSVCTHLATRVYPVDRNLDPNQAVEDWGLGLASWNPKLHYSVTVQDGRQITRMAMRRRISRSFKLPLERARAVSLDKTTKAPLAREIHHLADWIARFGRMTYEDVPAIAKNWFARGFLSEADEAFTCWLEAARAGDEGRWVEALHSAYQGKAIERHNQIESLTYSKFVRRKATDWPTKIGPTEFRELCLRLRNQPGYKVLRVYEVNGEENSPDLTEFFAQFGEVANVRIKRPSHGRTYALVTMKDEASAGRVVRADRTSGLVLSGRRLRIFPAQP